MNKYDALICTGRLEILLQGKTQLLNELRSLQKSIAENDYVKYAISFGKFSELVQKSKMLECIATELTLLATFIVEESEKHVEIEKQMELLNRSIDRIGLSTRTSNNLIKAGIHNLNDLMKIPKSYFLRGRRLDGETIKGLGSASKKEVMEKLKSFGLEMKD